MASHWRTPPATEKPASDCILFLRLNREFVNSSHRLFIEMGIFFAWSGGFLLLTVCCCANRNANSRILAHFIFVRCCSWVSMPSSAMMLYICTVTAFMLNLSYPRYDLAINNKCFGEKIFLMTIEFKRILPCLIFFVSFADYHTYR